MKGQKKAVIDYVTGCLPSFVLGQSTPALQLLSNDQLELIKFSVAEDIAQGKVEYGKDPTNAAEVRVYVRAMVMNHLKKAKELNGGTGYVAGPAKAKEAAPKSALNMDILTEDLRERVKNLVE